MTPPAASEISFALEQWCVWQAVSPPLPLGRVRRALPGVPFAIGEGWGEGENKAGQRAEPWPLGQVLPAHGESPDVGFLPLLQRRRLSPLARAALATVWPCRGDPADLPAVFASSHGESHAYCGMLEDLAAHRELSPSRFSLSVHNAIAGLYSQFSDSRSPLIVLAPGREGPFAAFVEAAGLLLEGWERVLILCYEQPLPEVYRPYAAGPATRLALALRVGQGGGPRLRLRRMPAAKDEQEHRGAAEPYPLQTLIEAIRAGRRRGGQAVGPARWEWSLDDA